MPFATALAVRSLVAASAATASAALGAPAGQALEHPRRAPGLWEVRTVGAQAAGLPPIRQCIGKASDTAELHLDRSAGVRGACRFGPYRRAGKGWVAESVCRQGRTQVVSRSIVTGDLQDFYRIDTLVRYEPPLAGTKREDREALEARRVGPCQPGQEAGDLVVPGMGTLNMVDGELRVDRK